MKVYLVMISFGYEDFEVIGLYTTKAKALKAYKSSGWNNGWNTKLPNDWNIRKLTVK